MANVDPMFQRVTSVYLSTVRASRESGFRTLPLKPPVDRAVLISMDWSGRIFRVPIHRDDDSVKHRYRVAQAKGEIDLLEHRLEVDSVPVQVYESTAFFIVFVPASAFKARDPLEKAARAARLLLAVPDSITFRPIASPPGVQASSSDPGRTLVPDPGHPAKPMGSWEQRIDAVFSDDEIALFILKMTSSDMMTITGNARDWFDELRKAPRQ